MAITKEDLQQSIKNYEQQRAQAARTIVAADAVLVVLKAQLETFEAPKPTKKEK